MSHISNSTELHARLFEFIFISPAAFLFPPVRSSRYFSGAVQDRVAGNGGPLINCFCTAVLMEMALRATKSLVAAFTSRERVLLLDGRIISAFLAFDQFFMYSSRLSATVV